MNGCSAALLVIVWIYHFAAVASRQGADDVHIGLYGHGSHGSVGEQKEGGAHVRSEEIVRITSIIIQGM
jgi:hypothetical protein